MRHRTTGTEKEHLLGTYASGTVVVMEPTASATGVLVVADQPLRVGVKRDLSALQGEHGSSGVRWIDRGYGTFRAVEMLQPMQPGEPTRISQCAAGGVQIARACRNTRCGRTIWGARSTQCPHCGMPGR